MHDTVALMLKHTTFPRSLYSESIWQQYYFLSFLFLFVSLRGTPITEFSPEANKLSMSLQPTTLTYLWVINIFLCAAVPIAFNNLLIFFVLCVCMTVFVHSYRIVSSNKKIIVFFLHIRALMKKNNDDFQLTVITHVKQNWRNTHQKANQP